jgi:spermidine/putrescine transport system substrate-binding protein
MNKPSNLTPNLTSHFNRRQILRAFAALPFAPSLLSACSTASTDRRDHLGPGFSNVRILNWESYIDAGPTGTVQRFGHGSTTYDESYSDNEKVYREILQPTLSVGKPAQYDIVCPTFWLAARLIRMGWVEPLPLDLIPNHVNLDIPFLQAPFDRGGLYSMPWQSGITGIAYNTKLTKPVRSIKELLTRADLKGRVGFFSEMRDSIGLAMLARGFDPSQATRSSVDSALEVLQEGVAVGQIRSFADNAGYLKGLRSGEFAACVAWSGDLVQLKAERPEFEFVIADEGGMQWFDTMVIPRGAPNGVGAAQWMDFVYDPANAAQITAAVKYISPVIGVRDELIKIGGDAATLAENPLLFPDAATRKRLYTWNGTSVEDEDGIAAEFKKITGL